MKTYSPGDQIYCYVRDDEIVNIFDDRWDNMYIFEIISVSADAVFIYIPYALYIKGEFLVDGMNYKNLNMDAKFIGSKTVGVGEFGIVGVHKYIDGMKCSKCKEFVSMAGSNQPDNSFICFLCRSNKYRG